LMMDSRASVRIAFELVSQYAKNFTPMRQALNTSIVRSVRVLIAADSETIRV
jgi:hypothetical protein